MADPKREQQDKKPCSCVNCQANQGQNKDDEQGRCKADADCYDQTCKLANSNKQQDERKEQGQHQQQQQQQQRGRHGPSPRDERQAPKSPDLESKDSKGQAKPNQKPSEPEANGPAAGSRSSGITPLVSQSRTPSPSDPALEHRHAPPDTLGGQQQVKLPENETPAGGAKKAVQPGQQPGSEQALAKPGGSPKPEDGRASRPDDAKNANGSKRPPEHGLEDGGKPSKQPKHDEQPKEERQPGQRQPGEQQQRLKDEQPSKKQPLTCTHRCPIHCAPARQFSGSNNERDGQSSSAPEREPSRPSSERRQRGQRRRSSRGGRRRSPAESRPRARGGNRRSRRPSGQRNPRRRR